MIDNGKRVAVTLLDHVGEAGFIRRGDEAELAYAPNRRAASPRVGSEVEADGARWLIEGAAKSRYVPAMTVLKLRLC